MREARWRLSATVVVYHAAGCHLCERALAQVRTLHDELGFELRVAADVHGAEVEAKLGPQLLEHVERALAEMTPLRVVDDELGRAG